MKKEISPLELGIKKIRSRETSSKGIVLEVLDVDGDGSKKADVLAERIKSALGDVAVVSRPARMAEFRVSGFDPLITQSEIRDAIASFSGCSLDFVSVGDVRRSPGGLRIAWVTCPVDVAKALASETFVTIGWSSARISGIRLKRTQCYKCWHYGHTKDFCKASIDRRGMCFRCAAPGHVAKDCVNPACCVVCKDEGLKCDHREGSSGCANRRTS